jgi:hypothetical protein
VIQGACVRLDVIECIYHTPISHSDRSQQFRKVTEIRFLKFSFFVGNRISGNIGIPRFFDKNHHFDILSLISQYQEK